MAPLLKDVYNTSYIHLLSSKISSSYPKFNKLNFVNSIFDSQWNERELKSRMRHISTTMG